MPTAAALTLEASGISNSSPTLPRPTQSNLGAETRTASPELSTATSIPTEPVLTTAPPLLAATSTQEDRIEASDTPFSRRLLPSVTATFMPEIPEARIQIYWIGELSKVTSPIEVIARLTSRVGKVVRVELYGEDGRLLARYVKVFRELPWHVGGVDTELEYEIRAAAELGRLVISVEDVYGRLIDLNSINIILLSSGQNEYNPASALRQVIVIQEPQPQTLIQGGVVYVSGLARPNFDQPLRIELISQDGNVLGHRLAGVSIPIPGGYGTFLAEVPYSVNELTPAILVVYEDGGSISEITHLSSLEVLLSP